MSEEIDSQLEWPKIDGTQSRLSQELKGLGANLRYYGNSSISSRNGWEIKPSEDAELNQQNMELVNALVEQGKAALMQKEYAAVEEMMQSLDKEGIFKTYTAGGAYDNPRAFDPEKYQELNSYRSSCCSNRDSGHFYSHLICDKEKFASLQNTSLEMPNFDTEFLDFTVQRIFEDKKINLKIGTAPNFSYLVNGNFLNNASKDDIDLNNPEALKAALHKSELRWPSISAAQTDLNSILIAKGYNSEREGRSGIANRNKYVISKPNTDISDAALVDINRAIAESQKELDQEKEKAFDRYFDEQSPDANKVYAAVNVGGDYSDSMDVDHNVYKVFVATTSAYTADHRYGRSHTYLQLIINEKRMKEDKRSSITLFVPKDLIGMAIGKGGAAINLLSKRYGKNFKVVQDPREIEKEKVAAIEEAKRQHQYEIEREAYRHKEAINALERNLIKSFGPSLIDAQDDDIAIGIVQYLEEHKESVSVIASREDLDKINEAIKEKRQAQKSTRTNSHNVNIDGMSTAIQDYIANYEQENEAMISPEQLQAFIKETASQERSDYYTSSYEGDRTGRAFEEGFVEGETAYLLERQQEAAQKISALKNFEKVANEEFNRFYANDAGSHGQDFFCSVGKARRAAGFETITKRTLKRLGLLSKEESNEEGDYQSRDNMEVYGYVNRIQKLYEESQMEADDPEQYIVNSQHNYEETSVEKERILSPEEKAAERERLKAAKNSAQTEEVDVSILLQAFAKKGKGRK